MCGSVFNQITQVRTCVLYAEFMAHFHEPYVAQLKNLIPTIVGIKFYFRVKAKKGLNEKEKEKKNVGRERSGLGANADIAAHPTSVAASKTHVMKRFHVHKPFDLQNKCHQHRKL